MTNRPNRRIRDVSDLVTKGTTPTTIGRGFTSRGVKFIKVETIAPDGRFIVGREAHIDDDTHKILRRSQLVEGDILFSIAGALGRTTVVERSWLPANTNQAFAIIRPARRRKEVDPRYLLWQLRSPAVAETIAEINVQAAQANLSLEQISNLEIPFLPLSEQRAIAAALDDVDALIANLRCQVDKKQAIKHGMMQQLLTGRRRLPGFKGVWEYRRVIEMGDVLAGKALNVKGAGALRPYLRTKNVLDGRIDLQDVLWMPMTDAEFDRFCIERGDVLLNEGQSLELVGRCSLYDGEFEAPCAMQNQLLRFRAASGTSPEFAAHLFRYCQRTGVFAAIATKTTSVAHLGSSRFSNLRLRWPADRLEQVAIAEVLSDMDTELAVYEERLNKARAIKQGMMQQLLTGRTRLKVRGSAE